LLDWLEEVRILRNQQVAGSIPAGGSRIKSTFRGPPTARLVTGAALADGFENLIDRQILLPLLAVARIVARAGAIQAQEPGEAIGTQLALQELKGVPFELLVR